jgi:hypothetical protein
MTADLPDSVASGNASKNAVLATPGIPRDSAKRTTYQQASDLTVIGQFRSKQSSVNTSRK